MDWSHILLGLLQGITEFLPVSSSGHLFLMEQVLGSDQLSLSFVLLLHVATFLSVLAVFYKDIKSFIIGIQDRVNRNLLFKIFVSLIPLLFVGLFFRSFVQQSFERNTIALGFLSSGLILLSLFFIRQTKRSLQDMGFLQAFLIGLAQALAVLPGFSRSGWTIAIGLYCGLTPRASVFYSFLISLPAIAGSAGVNLILNLTKDPSVKDLGLLFVAESGFSLTLSFFVAFFSGFLSLLFVLKAVQSKKLYLFSFYLIPLSFFLFFFL